MEIFELVVDYGLKFVAFPSAVLAVILLIVKLRKEVPFVRTTEAQQLEAARLLRSVDSSDGSGELHPYEKGLLYRILAKSRFVSIPEMELLLKLPDPYQHIDRLMTTKRLFDRRAVQDEPVFRFVWRYRRSWTRAVARWVVTGAYFVFALLALLPLLAVAGYHGLYALAVVSADEFSKLAGDLFTLLGVWLPVFGYLALSCNWWHGQMRRAENLIEAQDDFAAENKAKVR